MLSQAVLIAALTIGSGDPVTLAIHVEFDGATYLWNNGAGWQHFAGYMIGGPNLDVDGWKPISEYVATGDGAVVSAVLGQYALQSRPIVVDDGLVGEFVGASLDPDEKFYIGRPFATLPPSGYVAVARLPGDESVGLEITYDPTVYVPGDYNRDGSINLDDFAVLKANFGTGTTRQQGDTNVDGKVDLTDFGLLKENFGKSGGAFVPEPSPFLLGALAGLGLLALRRAAR